MKDADGAKEDLDLYLNDHLAGSVGALELVEHLTRNHAGTPLEEFFVTLHLDISADQEVLRDLMRSLEIEESTLRKAAGWMAEKMGRLKLGSHGDASGVGFLQSLEGLVMGIAGKQLLWRALAAAAERTPRLALADYAQLERRALEQRERVEAKRVEVARQAFFA